MTSHVLQGVPVDRSSIGRVFRSPLRWRWKMAALPLPVAILDDLISGSKMATGSGRAAIFHLHLTRDRKTRPRSWMTSFPTSPSWIQDGDGGNDVWRTSRRPWRHPWKGSKNVPQTSDFTESIWSLASPRHYPSDWVSCPLATTRKWSVCTCRKLWKTFNFSKLLLYFFFGFYFILFFLTVLYNSLELLYSTVS